MDPAVMDPTVTDLFLAAVVDLVTVVDPAASLDGARTRPLLLTGLDGSIIVITIIMHRRHSIECQQAAGEQQQHIVFTWRGQGTHLVFRMKCAAKCCPFFFVLTRFFRGHAEVPRRPAGRFGARPFLTIYIYMYMVC